jgi:hypothetical protein
MFLIFKVITMRIKTDGIASKVVNDRGRIIEGKIQ